MTFEADRASPPPSPRKRGRAYSLGELTGEARKLFLKGFNDFGAKPGTGGSSSENCDARLFFELRGGQQNSPGQDYVDGSTKEKNTTGCGHAEMAALHKFWVHKCGKDKAIFVGAFCRVIQCEAKPCCCRCSAVLGLLSVSPLSDDTKKTRDTMGGTNWGISDELRDLLAQICAVPAETFLHFTNEKF